MDRKMMSALLFSCFLFSSVSFLYASDLDNGWGDDIDWKKFDDALELSKTENKPVMLIIHKSWCGACKKLKPLFAESKEIAELSGSFIMANTLDDDEPKDDKYKPDGAYIPRILFIYNGKVAEDLYHEAGSPKYKYYYHNTEGIVKTMRKAVEQRQEEPSHQTDEL
ncbi:thioredoxin domain-containing protein 12-like [Mya arenaria]|uniref:thioredoxin domain-containing protein 12-like n=1 Tax=Mya arenaria TaxID=6604 RepID=UPI0022DEF5E3|nr:thioredoxin domain-containing protein 12-like [Mya arenaria]